MTKKYAKKRTSIGIEEDQMEKIIKVLMPNESLATFGRNALVNAISDRERSRLALLSDTEQFHKIEVMKKDIEGLKWRHDFLEGELNRFKKEQEEIRKELVFSDAYYKILMISSFDRDNTDEFKHKWINENIFSVINEDEYMKWKAQATKRLSVR